MQQGFKLRVEGVDGGKNMKMKHLRTWIQLQLQIQRRVAIPMVVFCMVQNLSLF